MSELKKEMLQAVHQEAESIMNMENGEAEAKTLGFINDDSKCNDVLTWYGLINEEEQELLEYKKKECERIQRFTDAKQKSLTNRRNFFDIALESYFSTCKGKSLSLQSGKIGTRKQPSRVIVENEEEFTKWWMDIPSAGDLMKIVHKPVLKEIKSYIQDVGECPEGVSYLEGKSKFYVKPNEE